MNKITLWEKRIVRKEPRTIEFEIKSAFRPSKDDIESAQADLGYDARGYGTPYDVYQSELSPGKHVTRWRASASSD